MFSACWCLPAVPGGAAVPSLSSRSLGTRLGGWGRDTPASNPGPQGKLMSLEGRRRASLGGALKGVSTDRALGALPASALRGDAALTCCSREMSFVIPLREAGTSSRIHPLSHTSLNVGAASSPLDM